MGSPMSYWPPPTEFPFTRENSGHYQNAQYDFHNLNANAGNSTIFYNQRHENAQNMSSSLQNFQFGANMSSSNQLPNGMYSNLTATAQEFTPSSSNPQNTSKKAANAYGRNSYGKNRSKYYNSRASNYDERQDRERDYRNRNTGQFKESKREIQSQNTDENLDSGVSRQNGPDMNRRNRYLGNDRHNRERDFRSHNRNSYKESKRETQAENSEVQNEIDFSRKNRNFSDERQDRERDYRSRNRNSYKESKRETQAENSELNLDAGVSMQNEVDFSRKNRNFSDERQDRERDYRHRNRTSFKTPKKDTQLQNVEESLDDSLVLEQNESDSGRKNRNSAYDKGRFNRNGYVKYSGNSWSGKNNYGRRNNREEGFDRNWRQTASASGAESSKNSGYGKGNAGLTSSANLSKKKLDAGSQRERLEHMLIRRTLECLVCCDKLRHNDKIWTCKQCYHILHLNCTVQWAKSSKLEAGWRCPACQNVCADVPSEYRCYCGKTAEPRPDPSSLPHSCGEVCGRKGRTCAHRCTLLCHPGPCPDCEIVVGKSCGCGRTKPMVKCGSEVVIVCKATCDKTLNCGAHTCAKQCHGGACDPCDRRLVQECHCGKQGRKVLCTADTAGQAFYACEDVCDKPLACGNHKCRKLCHEGECEPCALTPDRVKYCLCGQTKLEVVRTSCLDSIPSCDKICNKRLKCGQPSSPHECQKRCHEGACPPCPLTTLVRCRCGHMDKEIPCATLTTKADDARCEKKCTKKRLCGKHRCNQRCCIEIEHICPLPCSRQLSCGLHRCPLTCHSGRCPPCSETSFEELYCECGASVLYPPIACGTKPPPCNQPCSRERECGHEVNHTCHTGPCPPCTVLCKRWCFGHHEQRSAIPCHQTDFSCGLPCGLPLPCGRHACVQPCHAGPCPATCTQSCTEERPACGHPCAQPCHDPPCPDAPCRQMVRVSCECGLRTSSRPCVDLTGEYQSIVMANLASKMAEMQKGHAVDISDIVGGQKKAGTLKTLECNDECRIVERNRRLAIGLQIRNPDLSSKLTPRYSDYMRSWAKKDPRFCQSVHDRLTELVQLAKQSKQKSRSHSFESMNRDKRHFVHEYSEHFGCESAAYDQEPNRNVVVTAIRDKSWLPSVSLLELIQRENGQRRVPGPVVGKSSASKSETVSLRLPGRIPRPATPPGEYVDYFNNPPE